MGMPLLPLDAFQGEEHTPFLWEGGSPAALLIHGFPGTPAEMRPLAGVLHRAGWTVQGVLLPGFGREIATLPERHYGEWLAAVLAALEVLRRVHRPVILVGHSMGGALAIRAAAQAGAEIAGLVLLAPFWHLQHFIWPLLPYIRIVVPQFSPFRLIRPDFKNPELRKGISQFFPGADLDDPQTQQAIKQIKLPIAMFNQIRSLGRSAYRLAPRVAAPALVIQGTADDLVRPALTRTLIARLRGKVQYVEVNADHNLTRTSQPAWTRIEQALTDFIRQLEAPR